MAQKKGGGSTRNGRDSKPKYLGIKRSGGQPVQAGEIISRGNARYLAGNSVGLAKDFSIFSLVPGVVSFSKIRKDNRWRTVISVVPANKPIV